MPLVGGEWREVKALAVGAIGPDGAGGVAATDLSYCARLADHDRFGRGALAGLRRRGTLAAPTVAAVQDGAAWIQDVLDLHLPGAGRVLDFAHAAGYRGRAATGAWLERWLHELEPGDPARVLEAVAALPASEARDEASGYPAARRDHLRSADLRGAGYPIGGGCVERAGKLLVRGRLCGAGMRWAAPHVDAMLGLRTVAGTARWDAAWEQLTVHLRRQARRVRAQRRTARRALAPPRPAPLPTAAPAPDPAPLPEAILRLRQELRDRPKLVVNGRPTADHPLKRAFRPPQTPAPPALPQNPDAHPYQHDHLTNSV